MATPPQPTPAGGAHASAAVAGRRKDGRARHLVWALLRQREAGIVIAGLVIFVVFTFTSGGEFLGLDNWYSIASSAAELGVVTVGVSMLMVGGDFDLSVGANYAFSATVMALMIQHGIPVVLGLLAAMAIGAGIGLLNGLITIILDIPSFVATLGTWLLWSGIALLVAGGGTVTVFTSSPVLNVLGGATLAGGVHWDVLWWLVLAVAVAVVLHRTVLGNWIYAAGGNRQAAREAGVPVELTRIVNFSVCGLMAALAGVITLAHLQSMANSYGDYYQLYAIAAAVVGGCALYGGRGSIFGGFVGAVILSMLDSGLVLSGVSTYWYEAVIGVIVILAVAMHTRLGRLLRSGQQ